MKKALITGINGQDGAWLAKFLLDKNYEVYGGIRRNSNLNTWRLDFLDIQNKIKFVEFDLLDYSNIFSVIQQTRPDELYNLAAQSFVGTSFKQPISTSMIDGIGVSYILDILHLISPETKFYQASTSEMFGKVCEIPQNESTPFYPRSPYGCAKLYAHWMTVNYRESYKMFTTSGILFNHESELRGAEFVTRKITMHVAQIYKGSKVPLQIGNLEAERDWGYAKEYVEAMYLMLQAEKPDTYIVATGIKTKIRTFLEHAYSMIDRQIEWTGAADNEKGYDKKTGQLLIEVNPNFYRPAEVELLIGDAGKAKKELGWSPQTNVQKLAELMVHSDMKIISKF